MTIRQLKQTLRSVRTARIEIRELEEKREQIRTRAEKTTQTLTGMPSGSHDPGDKIGSYISEMSELTGLLDDRIRELTEQECMVIKLINKMNTGLYRSILLIYYVTGPVACTWEHVAGQIHYSSDWTRRLHGRALQELLTVVNKEDTRKHIDS